MNNVLNNFHIPKVDPVWLTVLETKGHKTNKSNVGREEDMEGIGDILHLAHFPPLDLFGLVFV